MEDYKVVWETARGSRFCTEWLSEKRARDKFEILKESCNDVAWAELIYSPVDDDSIDEEKVIDLFTKNVYWFYGVPLVTNVKGK